MSPPPPRASEPSKVTNKNDLSNQRWSITRPHWSCNDQLQHISSSCSKAIISHDFTSELCPLSNVSKTHKINTKFQKADLFSSSCKTTYRYTQSSTWWTEQSWISGPSTEKSFINPLNTKHKQLYLKAQFVPRSKHFSSRLQIPISLWYKWYKSLFVLR
jgi:hypothetical protein